MLTAPDVGRFFSFIRMLIENCPIYDLLYLNFATLLCFCILKRSNTKGEP